MACVHNDPTHCECKDPAVYRTLSIKKCDCEAHICEIAASPHQHIASKCSSDAKYRITFYGTAAYLCEFCKEEWEYSGDIFDSIMTLVVIK